MTLRPRVRGTDLPARPAAAALPACRASTIDYVKDIGIMAEQDGGTDIWHHAGTVYLRPHDRPGAPGAPAKEHP